MYLPEAFAEPRIEVLHRLMRARPLATLVTFSAGGLDANHIPLHLADEPAPLGTLRGHVARANPLWRESARAEEVLAIFHGPQAYVTPSWYATRAETGKVVPTWNYAVVHAHGPLRVVEEPEWLWSHLQELTSHKEAERAEPWRMSDAPRNYIEGLMGTIVGIEITISRLTGKWKTSQNQPPRNRAGVVSGLRERGGGDALEMAELVEALDRGK